MSADVKIVSRSFIHIYVSRLHIREKRLVAATRRIFMIFAIGDFYEILSSKS
jgi:hypothetical protein